MEKNRKVLPERHRHGLESLAAQCSWQLPPRQTLAELWMWVPLTQHKALQQINQYRNLFEFLI